MIRMVIAAAGLTGVYALALASADPWDLGLGAALSLAVLLMFRDFLFQKGEVAPEVIVSRFAHVPALVAAVAVNIVRGTVTVARAVLSPAPPRAAGFIDLPFGQRSESGVVISGFLDTLSPGSVLIDVDPESRFWTMHVLDASDEEGLREEYERFYQRYQRPIWP